MARFLHQHRIKQFCCSCPVRTGSLIIGILEVLGAIFQMIFIFVPIENPNTQYNPNAVYSGQITSCVLSYIVGLSLLWGVHKRSKDFLLPYLVLRTISWFVVNICIGMITVLAIVSNEYILLLFTGLFIIVSVLIYYFWRCVLSFFFELAEGGNVIRPNI